jgi:hypothetical protein
VKFDQEGSISIYSVLGDIIETRNHKNSTLIHLNRYEPGVYIIQFHSDNIVITNSFVKKNKKEGPNKGLSFL